jgi:hypothetical protein
MKARLIHNAIRKKYYLWNLLFMRMNAGGSVKAGATKCFLKKGVPGQI